MTRRTLHALRLVAVAVLATVGARQAGAQSLARRITSIGNGDAQFTFASREGVCGDGATFIQDGLGGESRIYENGNIHTGRFNGRDDRACESGPVRLVVSVADGEVVQLRTYAGPVPRTTGARRDLGEVSVSDAEPFLRGLAERANGRVAEKALLPLVLADGINPWPTLLRLARDDQGSRAVRHSAGFWLSRGAADKLGVADADENEDDEVRASAVFALSQQPREQSVHRLMEIVRTSRRPAVRAQALFWLGQSGDVRAIDLFAEILERR
jgi:HEAT repeat protein